MKDLNSSKAADIRRGRVLPNVASGVKAGGLQLNHNAAALRVKSGVRAGGLMLRNHSLVPLRVKTGIKAGPAGVVSKDG